MFIFESSYTITSFSIFPAKESTNLNQSPDSRRKEKYSSSKSPGEFQTEMNVIAKGKIKYNIDKVLITKKTGEMKYHMVVQESRTKNLLLLKLTAEVKETKKKGEESISSIFTELWKSSKLSK